MDLTAFFMHAPNADPKGKSHWPLSDQCFLLKVAQMFVTIKCNLDFLKCNQ